MIDVVVGGQFGSEGKGKVAYHLCKESKHKCVARVGGPNSGHTVKGEVLKQLPASALIEGGTCIITAGSYINPDILNAEIKYFSPNNLLIHPNAVAIQSYEPEELRDSIGSTLSGTTTAVEARIKRGKISFIKDFPHFKKWISTPEEINNTMRKGCILEGSQGFGLSVLHSPHYPYVTSRDTTVSGIISEAGISPKLVKNIYLVIRTYPIRVAGNSGPLYGETSWEALNLPKEITTVTKRVRRVGIFNPGLVRLAIMHNTPSYIVLNHLDYILEKDRGSFIKYVENSINRPIDFIGLGPDKLESYPL